MFLSYFSQVKCTCLEKECIIWTGNTVPFYYTLIFAFTELEKKVHHSIPFILFFCTCLNILNSCIFFACSSSRLNIYDLSAYLYEVQMGSSTSYSKCFNAMKGLKQIQTKKMKSPFMSPLSF